MEPLATPDLDADRDPDYARRAAAVSRGGQAGLALVVLVALSGAFGGAGPLLKADAVSGSLSVEYDRFGRLDAPYELSVSLPVGDSVFVLTGDLARLQIEEIIPAPSAESATDEGRRFVVDASNAVVRARTVRFGVLDGAVAASGGRVAVRVLVYP